MDGSYGIIHTKQNGGDGSESLVFEVKTDICLNCRVMKMFHEQKDYAALGTEDGVLCVYEIQQNTFQLVGSTSLAGSVVDIAQGDAKEGCLLHLLVSCEGSCSYEVELHAKTHKDIPALSSREIPKHEAATAISYGHMCWYYSKDHYYCSCEGIRKCLRVVIPGSIRDGSGFGDDIFIFILRKSGELIMQDSQDKQYKLSIIEKILDFNVQLILDNNCKPRLILMCRDVNFFSFYTDILSFFRD